MSTIAYRNGLMAADTQSTRGTEASYGARKLYRTERFLVGFCGRYCLTFPFLAWVRDADQRTDVQPEDLHTILPDLKDTLKGSEDEIEALIADKMGRIWTVWSNGFANPIHRTFAATGSGADWANGAMAVGGTSYQAVEAACAFDIHSGGKIETITF